MRADLRRLALAATVVAAACMSPVDPDAVPVAAVRLTFDGGAESDTIPVRGTTRDPAKLDAIAAAGAEPYLGDPDRIATLMDALAQTTIVAWLRTRCQVCPCA